MPIEVVCRQLCLGRGCDPEKMVPGHDQPLFGMTMADGYGPGGEIMMRQWRTFLAQADALILALDRAGFGIVKLGSSSNGTETTS